MADTSAPTHASIASELSDPSCAMGGSMESEFHTALASEIKPATTASSSFLTAGSASAMEERTGSGKRSTSVEEQIEHSKSHWSLLTEPTSKKSFTCVAFFRACLGRKGPVEIDNVEVFKTLQLHPTWGAFFKTFGYDLGIGYASAGSLEVGAKFAEGAQAELFHAHLTWSNPKGNEDDLREGREWVLKVFKKGTLLRHLQSQWPLGYLQWWAEDLERTELGKSAAIRHRSDVMYGTLLKDGRFAFLMVKEQEDLRSVIHRNMQTNIGKIHGPFQKDDEEMIMYRIALGMDWLHNCNIVHRDLKASNVLVNEGRDSEEWMCSVADYECSIGVVETGFWRAPEILQACKEKNVLNRPELFTKQADVYSYGMTCYEILTGKLPFEGHHLNDYDLVLKGKRPELLEYIDNWARGLLNWCWNPNPIDRPSFQDILNLLVANSTRVKEAKQQWEVCRFV